MKFSIIIPAHNSKDTIEKCILSIVNQKGVDIQVIIVENGSIDNTLDICRGLQKKYDNIEVYVSNIPNVSVARNEGIKHVTGDIVTFCDADDYLLPNSLPAVEQIFNEYEVGMVCTGFQIERGDSILYRNEKKEQVISSEEMMEYIQCNPNTMGSVWNKFLKKELVAGTGFRPELTYLEDGFFNIEVLLKNKNIKVFISPTITYCYVSNEESVTNDYTKLFDDNSRLKYLNSLNKMLTDLSLTKSEKKYTQDNIFRLAVGTMWNKELKKTSLQSKILCNEIKKNMNVFAVRVFRFNWKSRVKLLVKGLIILTRGRRFGKDGQ